MGRWLGFPLEQSSTEGSTGYRRMIKEVSKTEERAEATRNRSTEHVVPAAVRSVAGTVELVKP
jgi:hypothetical protein